MIRERQTYWRRGGGGNPVAVVRRCLSSCWHVVARLQGRDVTGGLAFSTACPSRRIVTNPVSGQKTYCQPRRAGVYCLSVAPELVSSSLRQLVTIASSCFGPNQSGFKFSGPQSPTAAAWCVALGRELFNLTARAGVLVR